MAAPLAGTRGTGNITQSIRKVDMATRILDLQPDAAPLTVLASRLNKAPTVNPEYSWQEDDLEPRYDTINNGAGYNSSATSIVVTNGGYFHVHDLVYITRTGETMRVTVVSTNTLTVVRGVGSTAAAIVNADELLITGSAQPEGDVSKAATSTNTSKVTNYTQIFRRAVDETETLRHSDQFTQPNDWDRQRAKTLIEHQRDKEFAFLFGHASEDTSGTHPRRTTGGVTHYITTNQVDGGGTMSEATFFGALRTSFRYGSRTKLLLAAPLVADVLNTYARSKIQVPNQSDTSYGVNVTRFVSPHGVVNLATHWALADSGLWKNRAILIDLDQIRYRYLANENGSRDSHIRENIQTPDSDTRKDECLAEVGLEFGLEKAHSIVTNVTG